MDSIFVIPKIVSGNDSIGVIVVPVIVSVILLYEIIIRNLFSHVFEFEDYVFLQPPIGYRNESYMYSIINLLRHLSYRLTSSPVLSS